MTSQNRTRFQQNILPSAHHQERRLQLKDIIKAAETVGLLKFSFMSKIIQVSFSGVIFVQISLCFPSEFSKRLQLQCDLNLFFFFFFKNFYYLAQILRQEILANLLGLKTIPSGTHFNWGIAVNMSVIQFPKSESKPESLLSQSKIMVRANTLGSVRSTVSKINLLYSMKEGYTNYTPGKLERTVYYSQLKWTTLPSSKLLKSMELQKQWFWPAASDG